MPVVISGNGPYSPVRSLPHPQNCSPRTTHRFYIFSREGKIPESALLTEKTCLDNGANLAYGGKASEALECCEHRLRINPDNYQILNNKAVALIRLGRVGEALAVTKRAAGINPASVDTWVNMGITLEKLNRQGDARDALERAIRLDPYNAYARTLLGIVYDKLDMGNLAEAQRLKLQEIAFPKVSAGMYFSLAAFLLGLLFGAIPVLDRLLPEISLISQGLIILFFLGCCGLFWKTLREQQALRRLVITGPRLFNEPGRAGTRRMYVSLAALAAFFMAGILIGTHILHPLPGMT